jgi:hypothetical protein
MLFVKLLKQPEIIHILDALHMYVGCKMKGTLRKYDSNGNMKENR